jgi:aryl-alcohol dehydrogenase-like predicted oxidoreductase
MDSMKRILGKSNIEISGIGMGCWAIGGPVWLDGRPDGYGIVDNEGSKKAIRQGVAMGVNFFDTSDVYGTGHSERILGEALKGVRDKVVIGTKFGYTYNEDIRHITGKYVSPEYIRWALEQSLRRLQTDYIDLYTIHVGSIPEEQMPVVMNTLDGLQEKGLIRAYCWSTSELRCAEYFAHKSNGVALMHTLNVFTCPDRMLQLCEKNNLASINIFPLAMGMLSGKFNVNTVMDSNEVRGSGHSWVKYFENGKPKQEYLDRLDALREILTSQGRTLVQGALAWIWAKGDYTIPIPGFKTVEQVIENARAMDFGPLTNAQMVEIEAIVRESSSH